MVHERLASPTPLPAHASATPTQHVALKPRGGLVSTVPSFPVGSIGPNGVRKHLKLLKNSASVGFAKGRSPPFWLVLMC
jgi:hypothetical protein